MWAARTARRWESPQASPRAPRFPNGVLYGFFLRGLSLRGFRFRGTVSLRVFPCRLGGAQLDRGTAGDRSRLKQGGDAIISLWLANSTFKIQDLNRTKPQ